ncbi:MAG: hypothetical protein AAF628_35955 [Planctomycetota bacterium]
MFALTNSGSPALYPRAELALPPAKALALSGRSLDGVVVLFDAAGNVADVSNVDREAIR